MSVPAPGSPPRGPSAYRSALTPKQREAEVFAHATRSIRVAEADGGLIARARAIADNRLLWEGVRMAVIDPTNQLPGPLRAQLAALARTVLHACEEEAPDLAMIAEVNEHMSAALWH